MGYASRMRYLLLAGSLVAVAASCLLSAEHACHQRVLAAHGCCPFCQDDCEVSEELLERECGADADPNRVPAAALLDEEQKEHESTESGV